MCEAMYEKILELDDMILIAELERRGYIVKKDGQ